MAADVQCKKIGRNVELARVKNKKQNELLKYMGLGAMTDAYSTEQGKNFCQRPAA